MEWEEEKIKNVRIIKKGKIKMESDLIKSIEDAEKKFYKSSNKLMKRLASEATRTVKTARNKIAKDVSKEVKARKLVAPRMTLAAIRKNIFSKPESDRVTTWDLRTGFYKMTIIGAKPLNLRNMRVKVKRKIVKKDKKHWGNRRYVVNVFVGGKWEEYKGTFLLINKQWTRKPKGSFYGVRRRNQKRWRGDDRDDVVSSRGIGVSSMLNIAGVSPSIVLASQNTWRWELERRLGGVIRRFEG